MDARAAQSDYESLYHRAFAEYGIWALWNCREIEHPTPDEAMAITHSLRVEGDLKARRLAELIEQACRASGEAPYRRF